MSETEIKVEAPATEESVKVEEAETGQVEAAAEAVVEVAKIEAERDVELAKINTEASKHAVDVAAGVAEQEAQEEDAQDRLIVDHTLELEECRKNIGTLQEQMGMVLGQLSSIQVTLNPPLPNPSEPVEESLEVTEENLAAPEEPPRKRRTGLRLI